MEIVLSCAYAFLFYYLINRSVFFQTGGIASRLPGLLFLLKCVMGVLLGIMYIKYYTDHNDADTFKFYSDSKIIFDTLLTKPYDFFRMFTGINGSDQELRSYYVKMDSWLNTSPLFNDNRTMIRLNTLFRFFSLGYYNVHVVLINIISFAGLFCLYKAFIRYVPNKKIELLLLIFLTPSVLFWGSGLLKDGLLIAGFGILIYSFTLLMEKGISRRSIIFFLLSVILLVFIKIYVLALLIPGLVAWAITRKSSGKKIALTFIAAYVIYFAVAFNLYHISDRFNVAALLFYKQKNFVEIGIEHSATMISYPVYECSGPSILFHSPFAFSNTFIRPFPWEVHGNPMVLLSALENLMIIGLILLVLFTLKIKKQKSPQLLILSVAFILTLFTLIGLITPVLGAIVRYRIIALPCLMFVLIYFYDREKIKNFFSRKRIN